MIQTNKHLETELYSTQLGYKRESELNEQYKVEIQSLVVKVEQGQQKLQETKLNCDAYLKDNNQLIELMQANKQLETKLSSSQLEHKKEKELNKQTEKEINERHNEEIKALRNKVQQLQERLQENKLKYDENLKEKQSISEKVDELQSELDKNNKKSENNLVALDDCKKQLTKLQLTTNYPTDAKNQIETLNENIHRLEGSNKKLQEDIAYKNICIKQIEAELNSLKLKEMESNSNAEKLKQLNDELQVCRKLLLFFPFKFIFLQAQARTGHREHWENSRWAGHK